MILLWLLACTADEAEVPPGCVDPGTDGATATCLAPRLDPQHYVDEALAALVAGKAVAISETTPYGCSVKYAK